MRRLLVIASRPSDYVELSELASILARRHHRVVLLYFYLASQRAAHEAVLAGLGVLGVQEGILRAVGVDIDGMEEALFGIIAHAPGPIPVAPSQAAAPVSAGPRQELKRLLQAALSESAYHRLVLQIRAARAYRRKVLGPFAQALWAFRYYRRFLRAFSRVIEAEKIDAVLIPEDIVGNLWPVAIKAGHDAGIPTLVFPYTLANMQEAFQSLRDEPGYQTAANRLAALLFPRWRLRLEGRDLVRLPSEHIFAHHALRIAPPDPWMMNSGYANRICVDSEAAFEYFKAGGIPPAKMVVTGSVSQDEMHALKKEKAAALCTLRRELGLVGEKPLLLLSGCPDQLAGKVPFCEFASLAEIAGFVGRALSPLGEHYHLVVRPHPNYPQFGAMLAASGFAPTMTPTSRLVPVADLFVAFASATLRWAIACAVPAINYDVFHYGYGDFAAARGLVSVQRKDDFLKAAAGLAPGSEPYAGLARAIAADSAHWSMMDGRSIERIEAAIEHECARKPAPRTAS